MSAIIHRPPRVDRRTFITAMGGGAAALGLAGCADDGADNAAAPVNRSANAGAEAAGHDGAAPTSPTGGTQAGGAPAVAVRSDSIVPELTRLGDLTPASESEERMSYVPNVPSRALRNDQRIVDFHIDVIEATCLIDPDRDVSTRVWGFRIAGDSQVECGAPGPVLRARVGDLARITAKNLDGNEHPHNIDFHAVTGQGGGAAGTTVAPGESATINCRLLYPGVFMYHCAFGDVPEHIVHGMYGMFIVDPAEPLPDVDHEWAITQSEWYVGEPTDGVAPFDRERLTLEHPTYVTFNGRTDALTGDNALAMNVGERARFYMVNEGLNLASNFHPIGSHWDVVYPEAATHPVNRVIRGSQSTLVVAGGGTVAELVAYVPSTIILVDHALVRTFYKGCIGLVHVSGDENAIYSQGDDGLADAIDAEPVPAPQEPNTIVMPEGAWEPANAATAYTPTTLTVAAGTTVVWRNDDSLLHTVTSGSSNGSTGTHDGKFDSGNIEAGESWEYTFDEPGTYDYYCAPHPWMIGTVEVTE